MKKEALQIAEQIKQLADQLAAMASGAPLAKKPTRQLIPAIGKKGATGAIAILIEEKFFNTPRDLPAVIDKLKQMGRYYPKSSIAMNLLNLTKRRIFIRIKDNKTKNWQYVLRR
ncbi:hypothetical protein ES703_44002 [subsurface metagenome]